MSAPTSPLTAIDARLEQVRAMVEHIGSNLLAFDADPIRQLLDTSSLTGTSASTWAASAEQLGLLWQGHAALSALVREATGLRGDKRRISDADLARLETLLLGPALPAPNGYAGATFGTATPGPGRTGGTGLTGSTSFAGGTRAPVLSTVDEVVAALSSIYGSLADIVARATTVWEQVLPRLGDVDTALLAAEAQARAIGARIPNGVAVARRELAAVCDRALADPLSVDPDRADAAARSGERARDAIMETVAAFGALQATAQSAADALDTVAGLLRSGSDAAEESEKKLARWKGPADDLRRAEEQMADLRAELDTIGTPAGADPTGGHTGGTGNGGASADTAVRRMEAIRVRVAALLDEARQLAAACGSGLAARAELRGRLEAYRARASSSGRGEDLDLDRMYHLAQDALYATPCDLQSAGQLVARYQDAVRAPGRPTGPPQQVDR